MHGAPTAVLFHEEQFFADIFAAQRTELQQLRIVIHNLDGLEFGLQHRLSQRVDKAVQAVSLEYIAILGEGDVVVEGLGFAAVVQKHEVFALSIPAGRYAIFIYVYAAVHKGKNDFSLGVHQAGVAVIGHGPGPFVLADDCTHVLVFHGDKLLPAIVDNAGMAALPDNALLAVELDAVVLGSGQFPEGDGVLLDFLCIGTIQLVQAPDALFL